MMHMPMQRIPCATTRTRGGDSKKRGSDGISNSRDAGPYQGGREGRAGCSSLPRPSMYHALYPDGASWGLGELAIRI